MRPHIRQAVTIAGLGLDYFHSIIQKFEEAYIMFSNMFPPNTMIHWQPGKFHKVLALDVHARYFTHKGLVKGTQIKIIYILLVVYICINEGEATKPFERFVDPNDILLAMQEDQYIYHDDNVVEYFGRYITKDGHTM